ncbi:hypothetical protein A3F07_04220 [candidate division WWE3 bacterium RIFCSPHIGHO2_12_FULL_38_15]|uniref:YgjP-like metallopeptidase domain-containing protein n=1 Tax=candidate division WWE3 bacterium RIFCSPHIGHO2_02_FULL_38_14 TaxID=1802620 RepID=A0A1F4V818_UNCKA|nr:MAG: hypothetical protein A2793_01420 [candidate division WWE3 bacterium RIFCSPHIGHO2_01_FULL_38_45]OGC48501.1 MAG: hypothetical protein A3F07_04220 [candidate division WWE3 bacterium RIFCSPHIGHO2_12_FULL_38_15]OGC53338.1 MAG: hypothetical protein A3D91_02930 [candidate division WWE3 bacterium RIFCSPHIGHO2_02_FULL_38_14]OGC53850.1 MAG: hypothetical protein A3B64_00735 [candidate division WWE3 bacterium RIFCSPLOWO2_01_FULL_37_24]
MNSPQIIPYLGKDYQAIFIDNSEQIINFDNKNFYFNKNHYHKLDDYLNNWYFRRANEIIIPRVMSFANKYTFKIKNVRLKNTKSRWGSCSFTNNININWHLIKAPETVIDYVIIHELVHTDVKGHSRIFWRNVESYIPEYKQYENWLKENSNNILSVRLTN